ncbi:MAG: D-alanine--D-alanine ligase family protein [Bacteroidota bacterium]
MSAPLRVALVYGGLSSEHDISIRSAKNVHAALDPARYRVTPVYIDRAGRWHVEAPEAAVLLGAEPPAPEAEGSPAEVVAALARLDADVAFPVLHGQNGEDGTIQGLFETIGLPYVGPGVLASAACMDKEVTKRLLGEAGIPQGPYLTLAAHVPAPSYHDVAEILGRTLFVKPANSGSSVGISKVEAASGWEAALDEAFAYDRKVLVEAAIPGREIEVAVLGNEHPEASVPGEIVTSSTFYTYHAKYEDPAASRMEVPADLPEAVAETLRALAVDAYRALGCEGMARVDFFLPEAGGPLVNEINTIPGFTARSSMYPVMWERTGLAYADLVDRLIALALDRHARDAALLTSR